MQNHRELAYTVGGTPIPMPELSASRSSRALRFVGITAALLIMLLMGLLTLLIVGAETGKANLAIGAIVGLLPVPLYLTIILWIDRYETEPPWLLAFTFFWGATVAVFGSLILNTVNEAIVSNLLGASVGGFFGVTISAPLVEETFKGAVLFLIFFWQHDEFDGVVDGIVYGSLVALGFATIENFLYYGRAAQEGQTLSLFLLRGGLAPFSHPLFTSMTGIGLGLSRQSDNKLVKWLAPLVGLLAAMFLHFVWNTSAVTGLFPIIYLVFMVPAFVAFWLVVIFALRREGRIVRQYLTPEFERGWLTSQDYQNLGSVRGRLGSSLRAFGGGVGTWRKRMQYNQVASELAFLRSRIARNTVRNRTTALQRENTYLQALMSLRQQLGHY